MISSPAVITMSLFPLFPYSTPNGCVTDMPSLSTLPQSLQRRFTSHKSFFCASQWTYVVWKTVANVADHLDNTAGIDTICHWAWTWGTNGLSIRASEKEVNSKGKSVLLLHVSDTFVKQSLCNDRTVAFFHLVQYAAWRTSELFAGDSIMEKERIFITDTV